MTLDEAIEHAEEVAEINQDIAYNTDNDNWMDIAQCEKCAEEHRQLAEWLRELKQLKEQQPCGDAISRQAVLDIAKSSKSNWIDNSVLFKRVNELPSVEPKRKTGEWLKVVDEETSNSITWHYECSLCESRKGWEDCDYCPNCGAKMKPKGEGGGLLVQYMRMQSGRG